MSSDPDTVSVGVGIKYTLLLFSAGITAVLSEGLYFQIVMRLAMQVRSIIVSSVFAKTLLLSNTALTEITSGRINNMVSSDAESIQMLLNNIHQLWLVSSVFIVSSLMLTQSSIGKQGRPHCAFSSSLASYLPNSRGPDSLAFYYSLL
jgi:ABC-type multidrug transport system fused ATPase/permease subunit